MRRPPRPTHLASRASLHLRRLSFALPLLAACPDPPPALPAEPAAARVPTPPSRPPELRLHAGYYDTAALLPGAPLHLYARGGGPLELRARSFGLGELGLHLRARWVAPDQPWPAALPPPTTTIQLQRPADDQALTIDLAPLARGADEQLLLTFHAPDDRLAFAQLVQITPLGLSAALDARGGLIWVTRLDTGEPLADVELTLRSQHDDLARWSGRSDRAGLATIDGIGLESGLVLTARDGHHVAYLPLQQDLLERYWGPQLLPDHELRAFITSDRARYRPGDPLQLAGILRRVERGPTGGLSSPFPPSNRRSPARASYTLESPSGRPLAAGAFTLTDAGAFALEIPPPTITESGEHRLSITLPNDPAIPFFHSVHIDATPTPATASSHPQPQPQPQPQPLPLPQPQPQPALEILPDPADLSASGDLLPGQKATFIIRRAPHLRRSDAPAHGLLLLEREGILDHRVFHLSGDQASVELPIPEQIAPPNLHLSALLLHPGDPAFTVAALDQPVSLDPKRIHLEIQRLPAGPQGQLRLKIRATDARGAPSPALLLLDLIDPELPLVDPLVFFYNHRPSGAALFDLRTYLLPPASSPDRTLPGAASPERTDSAALAPNAAAARPATTPASPTSSPERTHVLPPSLRLQATDAAGELLLTIPRSDATTHPQRLRALALDPLRPDRLGIGDILLPAPPREPPP